MTPTGKQDEGFALAMVVFMLFAAAVAGVTGYQLVSAEASLADGNQNQSEALETAHGGLRRYVGEHIGIPGTDSFKTFQNSGALTLKAVVTPKKVAKLNDSTDLYLLTSVGTVTDSRYPNSPATRTAYQYAQLNRRPVKTEAAFQTIQGTNNVGNNSGYINGNAESVNNGAAAAVTKSNCPTGDTLNIGNVNSFGATGTAGNAAGNTTIPPLKSGYYQEAASGAALITAAGLNWTVLKNATFPIPRDGFWPDFAALPSDSFPVIRVTGNYDLDRSGRGALIVTGQFTSTAQNYTWKGIILAGDATTTGYTGNGNGNLIQGALVSGLNNSAFGGTQSINRFQVNYWPCYVRKANLSLAYLTPVSRSTWTY
jgi:hypothetical protein